jgi:plastocyanin
MQAYSLRNWLIALTHTMHTLRGMKNSQSLLAALFVSTLAFTSVACDDETDTKKDAAPADRSPDLAATEGGVDRTPDTTSTEVSADRTPDTTPDGGDGGVDKAPDTATDGPADVAADMAADMAADKAPDQAVDLPPDQAPDTTPDTALAVNGCTSYEDRTAAGADRSISFAMTLATDVERCIRIKVGQAVTFTTSSFGTHPLVPSGGDTPTPIRAQRDVGTVEAFLFPTAGVYGYKCDTHASMIGAIQVVP